MIHLPETTEPFSFPSKPTKARQKCRLVWTKPVSFAIIAPSVYLRAKTGCVAFWMIIDSFFSSEMVWKTDGATPLNVLFSHVDFRHSTQKVFANSHKKVWTSVFSAKKHQHY